MAAALLRLAALAAALVLDALAAGGMKVTFKGRSVPWGAAKV